MIINAFTLILSIFLFGGIKENRLVIKAPICESFLGKLVGGLNYLSANHVILFFIVIMLLPQAATVGLNVVMPNYVINCLGGDSFSYGLLGMFFAVGGILSSISFFIFASRLKHKNFIIYLFSFSIAALLVLAYNQKAWITYIMTLFFGASNTSIKIIFNSTLMGIVEKEFMGRVLSVTALISMFFQTITTYSVGWLLDTYPKNPGYMYLTFIIVLGLVSYIYQCQQIYALRSRAYDLSR